MAKLSMFRAKSAYSITSNLPDMSELFQVVQAHSQMFFGIRFHPNLCVDIRTHKDEIPRRNSAETRKKSHQMHAALGCFGKILATRSAASNSCRALSWHHLPGAALPASAALQDLGAQTLESIGNIEATNQYSKL